MRQTWRWFGPADEISIGEIGYTGAESIVTALHHVPTGEVWSLDEIRKRKNEVAMNKGQPTGLSWEVAESLPVSEVIKSQSGPIEDHLNAYRQSLRNLAECGVNTVCYNFMPILDWTRTELSSRLDNGGKTMSFDLVDFAAFDCFILEREFALEDYSESIVERARQRFSEMDNQAKKQLVQNTVAGLPGANDNWTLEAVRNQIEAYRGTSADQLRSNLIDFLTEVVPTAQECGVRLCCHPDDPPFLLLGLPRVMSSEADYQKIMAAVDIPVNGVTLCTGSLGVAPSFDPVSFVEKFGPRIHLVHLRNTKRKGPSDSERYSFYEAEHLDGDTNMVATIRSLLNEEARRRSEGRTDHEIPMRPDHGHALASDLLRPMMPGYPLIGRLRGLAELRGVIAALTD